MIATVALRKVSLSFKQSAADPGARIARMWYVGLPDQLKIPVRQEAAFDPALALGRATYDLLVREKVIDAGAIDSRQLIRFLKTDGADQLQAAGFRLRDADLVRFSLKTVAEAIVGRLAEPSEEVFFSKYIIDGYDFQPQVEAAITCLMRGDLVSWNRIRAEIYSRTKLIIDLDGAMLAGAMLAGADFSGVDLRSAILSGAILYGCNFPWANLNRAALDGTDTHRARFDHACLTLADLSGDHDHGKDFAGTDYKFLAIDDLSKAPIPQVPSRVTSRVTFRQSLHLPQSYALTSMISIGASLANGLATIITHPGFPGINHGGIIDLSMGLGMFLAIGHMTAGIVLAGLFGRAQATTA